MSPATLMASTAPAQPKAGDKAATPQLLVPFVRAAEEHIEPFLDINQILGASAVPIGPIDIPAYGFFRGIFLMLQATGGVSSVTTAKTQDAPFAALDEVTILDVNGTPIYGPVSGFDTYLINKYGGYGGGDPKQQPDFSDVVVGASASGNFTVLLWIPIEVNGRDALGSLANLNGASTYKLRLSIAPSSRIYTTAPNTTLPTVRVRAWLSAWTQPPAVDERGNANATLPPAHGTTSYWSKQTFNSAASSFQSFQQNRVGNYLRELIFTWRDGTGARVSTTFPAPLELYYDSRLLKSYMQEIWRALMAGRNGYRGAVDAAGGLDTGVFVDDFAHEFDGRVGYELRDLWLPTSQNTRLNYQGTFGAAGTLQVLTNDVSPVGDIFVG